MNVFQQEIQLQYALDVVDRCVHAYKNPFISHEKRGFAIWLARDILRNKKIDWSLNEVNSLMNISGPDYLKNYAKKLLKTEFENSVCNEVKNEKNHFEHYIYNSLECDN